ncbi:hypothetical protein CSPB12327_06995 [Campylobacter sp. RM12327]|uniref:hypothetical protein n=1 Tax=Campylobacter sputorum TaxID=206 RepID=UPI000B792650|nr:MULTISPECIES: hypothetical protein [Campylobacter]ASM40160.1 hypothetical protein CSPB_0946 [Campylobacter sputorum]MBE7358542.1 hypothetical protein [Campylobacter sp. RM11302]MBF6669884.1 hypothetical protein [Campylobacter sp. RM12327]MBF6675140.1 hypothetical protein [Campylobacter sp. RM13538]MBF6676438.1 hypothetical protein [Campylobacter sp. RM12321]
MVFILDACTVINLLQNDIIYQDDNYELEYDYLKLLKKVGLDIKIVEKVLGEIKDNYDKNLNSLQEKSLINTYISKELHNEMLAVVNQKDFESALEFTKKTTKYAKDNGELHSCSYALYLNRYKFDSFFETYFITDDDGAKNDFSEFFKNNLLGEIITTADLLLILVVKGEISLKNVKNFIHNLKQKYSSDLDNLINRVKKIQQNDINSKSSALLTKLLELINNREFEKINQEILSHKEYKNIVKKDRKINNLLKTISSKDLKKAKTLQNKIRSIKAYFWTIDRIYN